MRVLQVTHHFEKVGGAEVYLHALTDLLRARGHEVGVFGASPERELDEPDARVVQRPEWDAALLIRDPALCEEFRKFGEAFRPDVLHVHNTYTFPADLMPLLASLDRPIVQTIHDYGHLCPNGWCVWPDGTLCPGGAGRKCFEHGCEENYPYDARVALATWLKCDLTRRFFDAFLCPSHHLANLYRAHGFRGVHVVPHFVPPAVAVPSAPGRRERARLLYVGRLEKEKGLACLIEAMPLIAARVPGARLSLVGGGTEQETLERQAAALGVAERVTFHGKVPHEEVQRFFADASVLVQPSIWAETSSLAALESMWTGLPFVASAIGGLPDLVRPGENGFLFRPRDSADLADKVVRLLTEPGTWERLAAGRHADLSRHGREEHVERVEAIYRSARREGRPEGFAAPPTPIDPDLLEILHRMNLAIDVLEDEYHSHKAELAKQANGGRGPIGRARAALKRALRRVRGERG
jgi:glycosyltransferase involved in cell wall biosynthesis